MIIMIAAIIFSVLYGSHRSLSAESSRVESAFYNGVDGDGFSINNDLSIRAGESLNLVTIAKRYLGEDDPSIKAVRDAVSRLNEADDTSGKLDANQKLTKAYTALSDKLAALDLSAKDEEYRRGIIDELNSRNDIISHDGYNKMAENFNAKLGAFPANILSRLTGIRPFELFR